MKDKWQRIADSENGFHHYRAICQIVVSLLWSWIYLSPLALHAATPAVSPIASAADNLSVSICDDANEWPPYTYFERVGGNKSSKVVGFSVDVLDEIFARHQIRYTITMLPWARCLLEVKKGNHYQMVLDITAAPEREAMFWFSRPVYFTNTYYFYSRKKFPQGLSILAMADLKAYRVCGIHGYNVNYTGFKDFFKPGEVDQGTKDYKALIAKLHAQHCDLFLEQYQAMQGYAVIGQPFLDDQNLAGEAMPGLIPSPFRFAISRRYPAGESLLRMINEELEQMEASGRLKALWKKRVPK